jgi:hypothetical protein
MADLRDEITEALLKHGAAADVCCGSAIMPLVEAHVAAKVAEAKAEALREADGCRHTPPPTRDERIARDRQMMAHALRSAAHSMSVHNPGIDPAVTGAVVAWLRERADHIEDGAS